MYRYSEVDDRRTKASASLSNLFRVVREGTALFQVLLISHQDRELGRAKSDLGDLMNLESTEHVFDMPVVCGTDTITINVCIFVVAESKVN